MAGREKYALEDLPEAGSVFAVPLADGRFGVCRVLQRKILDVPAVLVATSDWVASEPTPLEHPAVRRILVLSHHNWSGKQDLTWIAEPPPKKYRKLGCIAVQPADVKTQCNSYGGWACEIQILMQWRWDNEREAVLAEDEKKKVVDLANQTEANKRRAEYLSKITFSKLLAKDFLPTWDDYPPEAAKEGCRRIIRAFIQTLAKTQAPLEKSLVATELKKCVEELNRLDSANGNFIETIEREDLCEVLGEVLYAAKFPDLADEIENWRDW